MSITASSDGGVKLTAGSYGSAAGFSVRWTTSGNADTYAGLDAAGTIDGAAATGSGQFLSLPTTSTSKAKGLRVLVSGTSTGSVGTVAYATGIAGTVASVLTSALDTLGGSVALAENARKTRVKDYNTQIASMERRATAREDSLRRQYAALDSTIGQMKSQQASLASQIGSM
jgi:flagellar hook-associated protein 2